MVNGQFLARRIEEQFVPQLRVLNEAIRTRLLPAFSGIDKEAEEVSRHSWEEWSQGASYDDDPASAAENAEMKGLAHYEATTSVRRAMMNAQLVEAHHLFEQQMATLLRFEIRHPAHENDPLPNGGALAGLFSATVEKMGAIDVSGLRGWSTAHVVRLTANTIKHADGKSADELRQLRPDLFATGTDFDGKPTVPAPTIHGMPAFGDEIRISDQQLDDFFRDLIAFWESLADAVR